MRYLTLFIIPFLASTSVSQVNAHTDTTPPKYILIHVCALSSHYMISELKAGNLPNLETTFGRHGMFEGTVTYFPSKTPNVISSLRSGTPVEESKLVSWTRADRESGEIVSSRSTISEMLRSKQRIALPTFFYGIPVVHRLGSLALPNIADLLDDYPVLEFYWYAIDTYGHFYGEESYLRKLRQFDKYFGRLMNRIDDDVNIIVYSDHGMVFEQGVRIYEEVEAAAGERISAISFPNIYIDDSSQAEKIAQTVLEETAADFTFFRSDTDRITGFHSNGTLIFRKENENYYYSYRGEDPFGYAEHGYNGEGMTRMDWLDFSHQMEFPATPVSIYSYFSNPRSGDILMLFDDTKFSRTIYSRQGNHGGFTYRDMSVPILVRGPELEFLYDRESMWLQDLFLDIENVPFGHTPSRDRHYVSWWHQPDANLNTMQVSFSPYYRWRAGTDLAFNDVLDIENYHFWVKFDLYRSYLARLWVGTGVETDGQDVEPALLIRHELRFRKLTARSTVSTTGNHYFSLEYRLISPLSIQIVNFNSAGLKLYF